MILGFLDEASRKVDKVTTDPNRVGTPEPPDEAVEDEGGTPSNGLDYIRPMNYPYRSVGSIPLSFTFLRISNLNLAPHIFFRLLIYTLMFLFLFCFDPLYAGRDSHRLIC